MCYILRYMEYTKNSEIEVLKWGGIAAAIMAVVLLFVGCAGPSAISTYSARTTASARSPGLEPPGKVRREGAEITKYLDQIHQRIHAIWSTERQRRAPWQEPTQGLSMELEMALDSLGQPGWVSVINASGVADFDAMAIETMMGLERLPPPPASLGQGHAFVRWRFFSDHRRCDPAQASLLVVRISRAEALARSLKSSDYRGAAAILREGRPHPALLAEVVRAGLADVSTERRIRVLPLAYSSTLEAICRQERGSELGAQALAELAHRNQRAAISRLLAATVSNVRSPSTSEWTLALLKAARVLKITPAAHTLDAILASPEVALVFAAAPMCKDAAQMDAVLELWQDKPAVAGPLWVRRCWLQNEPRCLAEVTRHLAGTGSRSTLRGLRRYPLSGVLGEVARMVRLEQDPVVRVEAIKVLEAYGKDAPLVPLYVALRAEGLPMVVAAAARVIGRLNLNPRGSSYRLAEVGFAVRRGPVATAALEGMARLGQEIFRDDVVRLYSRLSRANQAVVASALWGFGDSIRPHLSRLVLEQDPALAAAARGALARLEGGPVASSSPSVPKPSSPPPPAQVRTLDDLITLALSQRASSGRMAHR